LRGLSLRGLSLRGLLHELLLRWQYDGQQQQQQR
jgi:hypothetical protein